MKYKTRFVNEKLRIYYEGLNDGLSHASLKIRAKNPKGAVLYYHEHLKLPIAIKWKIKSFINYIRFSFHANIKPQQIVKDSNYKLLATMLLIFGYLYYQKDINTLNKLDKI